MALLVWGVQKGPKLPRFFSRFLALVKSSWAKTWQLLSRKLGGPKTGKGFRANLDAPVLTPNEIFDAKYLFYLMMSEGVVDTICSVSVGVSYPAVAPFQIGNIFVPYTANKAEQKLIVSYLDCKTAEINSLIAKKQRLVDLLNEEKTAIINHAVTKGLDPDVPMKDSGVPWIGEIPAHWEIKKIKYIATSIQTGSTPPSNNNEYFVPEIDWFTPSDFDGNLILSNSKRKISHTAIQDGVARLFPGNSVFLVGIGATLGKVGLIVEESSANQQINAITFDSTLQAKYFLFFLLGSVPLTR